MRKDIETFVTFALSGAAAVQGRPRRSGRATSQSTEPTNAPSGPRGQITGCSAAVHRRACESLSLRTFYVPHVRPYRLRPILNRAVRLRVMVCRCRRTKYATMDWLLPPPIAVFYRGDFCSTCRRAGRSLPPCLCRLRLPLARALHRPALLWGDAGLDSFATVHGCDASSPRDGSRTAARCPLFHHRLYRPLDRLAVVSRYHGAWQPAISALAACTYNSSRIGPGPLYWRCPPAGDASALPARSPGDAWPRPSLLSAEGRSRRFSCRSVAVQCARRHSRAGDRHWLVAMG
jgi:hypothetical protein